jgi:hypothetical protein
MSPGSTPPAFDPRVPEAGARHVLPRGTLRPLYASFMLGLDYGKFSAVYRLGVPLSTPRGRLGRRLLMA